MKEIVDTLESVLRVLLELGTVSDFLLVSLVAGGDFLLDGLVVAEVGDFLAGGLAIEEVGDFLLDGLIEDMMGDFLMETMLNVIK